MGRKFQTDTDKAFGPEEIADLDKTLRGAWNFVKASGDSAGMPDDEVKSCLALIVCSVWKKEQNVLRATNLAIARFRVVAAKAQKKRQKKRAGQNRVVAEQLICRTVK